MDTYTGYLNVQLGITCEGSTPHFSNGCELLLAYDIHGTGVIDAGGLAKAKDDSVAGIITEEELDFIKQASVQPNINALCPRCYSEECPKPPCTFTIT